jgi:hypothetical protein
MHGTTHEKVLRLVKSLAAHPRYALRYLLYGPLCRMSPLELGLPWFSDAAIDFLDGYMEANMEAFEWGSGGSTIFLASRIRSVVTVESDESWMLRVQGTLQERALSNVTHLYRPYDFVNVFNFSASEYLGALEGEGKDIIVVDGPEYDIQVRPDCFFRAERFVKSGGIIVIDDSWRYPEIRQRSRARQVLVFESTGPCRPGVTSTDIHIY